MSLRLAAVVAQIAQEPGINIEITEGLGGGGVGAFATTLVVGILLVALVPAYTEEMIEAVTAEPVNSFLYGILSLLGLVVLIVVLILSIVGLLFVIPLVIIAYLLWAVGVTIALLAITQRLFEGDDWKLPLLVAALLNGALALSGVGGIISFGLGAAGFGAILRDALS